MSVCLSYLLKNDKDRKWEQTFVTQCILESIDWFRPFRLHSWSLATMHGDSLKKFILLDITKSCQRNKRINSPDFCQSDKKRLFASGSEVFMWNIDLLIVVINGVLVFYTSGNIAVLTLLQIFFFSPLRCKLSLSCCTISPQSLNWKLYLCQSVV